jgi:hypothetical protein
MGFSREDMIQEQAVRFFKAAIELESGGVV